MERGKYRFELGQIIKGENGEYVITKREKRKDYTKKAIQRKRYTLVCPNKHEFEMEECHIEYRTPKCPLCYHPKIIMADPNFAVMFVNKEYPYKYTCMSHKKADFYCPDCGKICRDKSIHTVYQRKYVSCKSCGDGRSYGERMFAAILDCLEIKYSCQKCVNWKKKKFFYDFELDDKKILIEIHGRQHYGRGFAEMGGRTLEDEKKNDLMKRNIVLEIGYKLIVVDARESSLKYIRKSIEKNDELKDIINIQKIDWKEVIRNFSTKRDQEILKMLKDGADNYKIADKCKISVKSIPGFKYKFVNDGLWDGISKKEIQKNIEKEKIISTIRKLQENGKKSGDICKELDLNPATYKRWMGIDIFPDSKKTLKWTEEEAVRQVEENALPVELISGFINNKTAAVWKCKKCGTQFKATLLGIRNGTKCYQCKGRKKVEEYLEKNFLGEYEIQSMYVASGTDMKFKHLTCGREFMRTPHSIKRSIVPCLECGNKQRIRKSVQTREKNKKDIVDYKLSKDTFIIEKNAEQ